MLQWTMTTVQWIYTKRHTSVNNSVVYWIQGEDLVDCQGGDHQGIGLCVNIWLTLRLLRYPSLKGHFSRCTIIILLHNPSEIAGVQNEINKYSTMRFWNGTQGIKVWECPHMKILPHAHTDILLLMIYHQVWERARRGREKQMELGERLTYFLLFFHHGVKLGRYERYE